LRVRKASGWITRRQKREAKELPLRGLKGMGAEL